MACQSTGKGNKVDLYAQGVMGGKGFLKNGYHLYAVDDEQGLLF